MRGFLFGLGLGVGLGVLFAPMSGDEAREQLKERANDLAHSARDTFEQGRDRMRSGVEAFRGRAKEAMSDVRRTGTEGAHNL